MSSCCRRIWEMSGLAVNFRDLHLQFGSGAVARITASRSCTLSPSESTFFGLPGSWVDFPYARRISCSKARSFQRCGSEPTSHS